MNPSLLTRQRASVSEISIYDIVLRVNKTQDAQYGYQSTERITFHPTKCFPKHSKIPIAAYRAILQWGAWEITYLCTPKYENFRYLEMNDAMSRSVGRGSLTLGFIDVKDDQGNLFLRFKLCVDDEDFVWGYAKRRVANLTVPLSGDEETRLKRFVESEVEIGL